MKRNIRRASPVWESKQSKVELRSLVNSKSKLKQSTRSFWMKRSQTPHKILLQYVTAQTWSYYVATRPSNFRHRITPCRNSAKFSQGRDLQHRPHNRHPPNSYWISHLCEKWMAHIPDEDMTGLSRIFTEASNLFNAFRLPMVTGIGLDRRLSWSLQSFPASWYSRESNRRHFRNFSDEVAARQP